MLKTSIVLFISVLGEKSASTYFSEIDFVDMQDKCVGATELQIETELKASMKYLYMASFFATDNINRPGFAKLFFEAAGEEREHAQKLIEYLSMRGRYLEKNDNMLKDFDLRELVKNAGSLDSKLKLKSLTAKEAGIESTPGLIALQNALKLETSVTKSIRNLIKVCETDEAVKVDNNGKKTDATEEFNHYHVNDNQFFLISNIFTNF